MSGDDEVGDDDVVLVDVGVGVEVVEVDVEGAPTIPLSSISET